jgi:spermidine synthase
MGCNNSSAVCVKRTRINERNAQKVLKQNDSYDVITSDSENI